MPYTPTKIWKTDDPQATLNRDQKLKKIIEASKGLLLYLILSIDRIVISTKLGYKKFNTIDTSFRESFIFIRTYKVDDNDKEDRNGKHLIYEYEHENSKILLKKSEYSKAEPDKNWDYIILLDPTIKIQTTVKKILKKYIRKKNVCVTPYLDEDDPYVRVLSLSLLETALDMHPTKQEYTEVITRLINHYTVLMYCGSNSYGECEDTAYRGKNKHIWEGSKGLRTYSKDENDELFSRTELQSNWGQLRYNNLTLDSMPINPNSIDIFKSIGFKHGLNEVTFEKFISAITKSYIKSNKIIPSLPKGYKRSVQHILKTLALFDLGITSLSELKRVPVQKQIDIFKQYVKKYGGTHQVNNFFPRIDSWEELFDIIREELPTLDISQQVHQESTILDHPIDVTDSTLNHDHPDGISGEELNTVSIPGNQHERSFNTDLPVGITHVKNVGLPNTERSNPASFEAQVTLKRPDLKDQDHITKSLPGLHLHEDILAEGNVDHANGIKGNHTFSVANKTQGTSPLQDRFITYPPKQWQQVGRRFLNICKDNLRKSGTPWEILKKHGIDDLMIDVAELGWNPDPFRLSGLKWGLDKKEWQILTISEGLVVPHYVDFELTSLVVFSPDYLHNRYLRHVVPGSSSQSCLTFKGSMCNRTLVVDHELDAIYLKEIAGDLVNIVSLGEAGKIPDMLTQKLLHGSSRILIALGNTPEGIIASQRWLGSYGDRVRILPRILGKNLFQTFSSKQHLRQWILSDLTGASPDRYLNNYVIPYFQGTESQKAEGIRCF